MQPGQVQQTTPKRPDSQGETHADATTNVTVIAPRDDEAAERLAVDFLPIKPPQAPKRDTRS